MVARKFVWSAAVAFTLTVAAPAFADDPVAPPPLPAQVEAPRPAALMPLYVSFAALQVADAVTTLHNVRTGATEVNPLMNGVVHTPAAFVATKAALATVSILCAEKLWKRNRVAAVALMVGLNGMSTAIVARNYATGAGR